MAPYQAKTNITCATGFALLSFSPPFFTGLEAMLRSYFTGQQSTGLGPRSRPLRKNWSDMKCFSCGKSGHSATRCPTLDVSFPFILPV